MLKSKNLLSIVIVLVLLASLTLPTFAASVNVEQQVEQANHKIDQLIANAINRADQCYSLYQKRVNAENAFLAKNPSQKAVVMDRIKNYKDDYNNQINDIGNNLIMDAYNVVLNLYNRTSRSQVVFSVEYIPVQLGDKVFLVDPLRVVG